MIVILLLESVDGEYVITRNYKFRYFQYEFVSYYLPQGLNAFEI